MWWMCEETEDVEQRLLTAAKGTVTHRLYGGGMLRQSWNKYYEVSMDHILTIGGGRTTHWSPMSPLWLSVTETA